VRRGNLRAGSRAGHPFPLLLAAGFLAVLLAPAADGQKIRDIGGLASPGPLNRVHASLDTVSGCLKCHEPDKKVVAARCLACHTEVRKRIAAGKGLHRKVTDTCTPCHVEHSGRHVDLRPLDRKHFDHEGKTGFALEGRHKAIATDCGRCHKTRSFLTASPSCVSCHEDRHKGHLGADCARCHPAKVPFKETRREFDHGKTPYLLTGAHQKVRCELCHKGGVYKGLASASCGDCHKSPHVRPLGTCSTCHTTQGFRSGFQSGMVDHATTSFPLAGRHATVPCASCHAPTPATAPARARPKTPTCTWCHRDSHRGQFKESCSPCHKEGGPGGTPFDHRARTGFPLEGKHAEQPCTKCHKPVPAPPGAEPGRRVVDFRGARGSCSGCHADVHGGKLGTSCEKCHDPKSFRLGAFKHPRFPDFFVGKHAAPTCEKCHKPVAAGAVRRFKGTSLACASCHVDPHLGQVGSSCKPCHAPGGPKFEVVGFDHAKTRFPLTGKHVPLACEKCHRREEGAFPSGRGTAVRLAGLSRECVSCHKDVHRPGLGDRCEKCHGTGTFAVKRCPEASRGEKPRSCSPCHRAAYEGARSPAHAAAGFSGPCEECHRVSDASWSLGTFSHASWPLLGRHDRASCAGCHASGAYKGLSATCVSCHLEEYQRSQKPNHAARGLSTTCEGCHRLADPDWTRAAPRTP